MGNVKRSARNKVEIVHAAGEETLTASDRLSCLALVARLIAQEHIRSFKADLGHRLETRSGAQHSETSRPDAAATETGDLSPDEIDPESTRVVKQASDSLVVAGDLLNPGE